MKGVLEFRSSEDPTKTPIEIAIVPLLSYFGSIVFSLFFYKRIMAYMGDRLKPLLLACVLLTISSIPMFFMQPSYRELVFALVPFQGVGLAILLNTATSLIVRSLPLLLTDRAMSLEKATRALLLCMVAIACWINSQAVLFLHSSQ